MQIHVSTFSKNDIFAADVLSERNGTRVHSTSHSPLSYYRIHILMSHDKEKKSRPQFLLWMREITVSYDSHRVFFSFLQQNTHFEFYRPRFLRFDLIVVVYRKWCVFANPKAAISTHLCMQNLHSSVPLAIEIKEKLKKNTHAHTNPSICKISSVEWDKHISIYFTISES